MVMYLIILLLPFLGGLISGLIGRKLGREGSQYITIVSLILSSLLGLVAYSEVGYNSSGVKINIGPWIKSETIDINWGFYIDSLSVSMVVMVLIISSVVHIYSVGYMKEDPHNPRFFSYLSFFTFFMLLLLMGDNIVLIFVGWEGIGICSYLLINYWYRRMEANKAGMQALIMNRIGDWGYSIGLYSIYSIYGNWENGIINSLTPLIDESLIGLVCLSLIIAAMGKSAQLGLHGWLPTAMEGPTPVSSLIHAATLVTAGVYLLLRFSPLLEYSSNSLFIVCLLGSLTSIFASTTALVQNDIKKIIAYSTCSQLGYLFIAIGCSNYSISLFHLVNHAFFKALLFLSAGCILHSLNDEQDLRKMGGLVNRLPLTYTLMLIGSMSLIAFPYLTGFYSKDFIIETSVGRLECMGLFMFTLGVLSAIFTTVYSIRLLYYTFLVRPNGFKTIQIEEAPWIMILPLVFLGLASIFLGYIFKDLFIGLGVNFWDSSFMVHPDHMGIQESEFHTFEVLRYIVISVIWVGLIISLEVLLGKKVYPSKMRIYFSTLLGNFYWWDIIYNKSVLYPILNLGYINLKEIDRGVLEKIGIYGLEKRIKELSTRLSIFDTGYIPHYLLYYLVGVLLMLYWS